jgi:hypothetical protein
MIARLIVQTNSAGERHVTFTQDQVTPTEELLLTAPGWEDSTVTESRVLILSMDDSAIDTLVDTELHSAETQHNVCYLPNMTAILSQLNGEVR